MEKQMPRAASIIAQTESLSAACDDTLKAAMDEEFCPQARLLYEEVRRLLEGLRCLSDDFGLHNEVRRFITILIESAPARAVRVPEPWDDDW